MATTTDGFQVCFGAPYGFAALNSPTAGPMIAPAGTLPDGTQGFVGLLARCSD